MVGLRYPIAMMGLGINKRISEYEQPLSLGAKKLTLAVLCDGYDNNFRYSLLAQLKPICNYFDISLDNCQYSACGDNTTVGGIHYRQRLPIFFFN